MKPGLEEWSPVSKSLAPDAKLAPPTELEQAVKYNLTHLPMPASIAPFTPYGSKISFKNIYQLQKDILELFAKAKEHVGDYACIQLFGPLKMFLITDPQAVKHVLVDNHKNYIKGKLYWVLRRGIGNGLVTADGPYQKNQRKIIQPAFRKKVLEEYYKYIMIYVRQYLDRLSGLEDQKVDMLSLMREYTMLAGIRSIFDLDLSDSNAKEIRDALADGHEALMAFFDNPLALMPEFIPTLTNIRLKKVKKRLDKVVFDLMAEKRQGDLEGGDLISRLLRYQRDKSIEGHALTDYQIRNEVVTFLFTSFESTAATLSFTFYLLNKSPEATSKMQQELKEVLNGRLPTLEDLPKLNYTRAVIKESLRIFPTEWMWIRQSVEKDEINGYELPPNAFVFIVPGLVHNDKRWFSDPETFRPERFIDQEHENKQDGMVYFPFGGGPRMCIGKTFFELESICFLASLAQHYNFKIAEDHHIEVDTMAFLMPREGMPVHIVKA